MKAQDMREHLERRTLSRDVVDRLQEFGVYLAGAKFEMRDGNEVCVDGDFSTKARPLATALELPPSTVRRTYPNPATAWLRV